MPNGASAILAGATGGLIAGVIGTYLVSAIANDLQGPPMPQPGESGMIRMRVVDGLVDQNFVKYAPDGGPEEDYEPGNGPPPPKRPMFMLHGNGSSTYCFYVRMTKLIRFGPYPDEYHCAN